MKKIIVDLLGADLGQEELLEGVKAANGKYSYVLIGDRSLCDKHLEGSGITYTVVEATDFVSGEQSPMRVIKDGGVSIAKGLDMLKSDEDAAGLVTAGSTGAALIGTAFKFGLIKGLLSPVLCCVLIRLDKREFTLADCGANVSPTAEDMLRFAVLSSAFSRCYSGVKNPKVYLLNVGKEKGKGSDLYKSAYKLLESCDKIDFCGNIEADAIFTSDVDVLVCDGFAGNVLLKASEAVACCVKEIVSSTVDNSSLEKAYKNVDKIFAYNDLAGAIFLGATKPIVKLHGKANRSTVACGIEQIARCEKGGFSTVFSALELPR